MGISSIEIEISRNALFLYVEEQKIRRYWNRSLAFRSRNFTILKVFKIANNISSYGTKSENAGFLYQQLFHESTVTESEWNTAILVSNVWHLSQHRATSWQIFKLAHVLLSCGTKSAFLDISISMLEMPIWNWATFSPRAYCLGGWAELYHYYIRTVAFEST
jgi:hypothetical protein